MVLFHFTNGLCSPVFRNFDGKFKEDFVGKVTGNLDRKFIREFNKNFDRKGGIWRREVKSRQC